MLHRCVPRLFPLLVALLVALLIGTTENGYSQDGQQTAPSGGDQPDSAPQAGPVQEENAASAKKEGVERGRPQEQSDSSLEGATSDVAAGEQSLPQKKQRGSLATASSDPAAADSPTESLPKLHRRAEVVFERLNTPEPITLITMTEDGRFVLTSHQTSGRVSIYDVLQEQFVGFLETRSPRSILCRGDQVFVANYGEGMISVFSRTQSWRLIDEVEVEEPYIIHLSAPQGKYFDGKLLVTCHEGRPQGSYRGPHIYLVDVTRDQDREVARVPLATVSYDGRLVVAQDSFNLSSAGSIAAYAYPDFVNNEKPDPLCRVQTEEGQTPYVYQTHPGSYWVGSHAVFGGFPLKLLMQTEDQLLIPDLAQRLVYQLSSREISAHRLDTSLEEIEERRVHLPSNLEQEFHRISRDLYRRRDYLIDHLLAHTHGDQLHLFIIDYETSVILKATTPAFVTTAEASAPGIANSLRTDQEGLEQLGIPAYAVEGDALSVQLTGPRGAEYELLSRPQSMRLTPGGKLTWNPDADDLGVHVLKIQLTRDEQIAFKRPEIEVIAKELAERTDGGRVHPARGERLRLEPDHYQLTPGRRYQSLLLLQGDRLQRIGSDGLSVEESWTLPDRYRWIAEREDVWVALSESPNRLDMIDKRSLRSIKQIPLTPAGVRVLDLHDLAIDPIEKVSYVTVQQDVGPPRYRVLIVDEATGTIEAPGDLLGRWLEVDPAGRYLFAAYSDVFDRGSRFHISPEWQIIETPEYGSIDWLISYNLRGKHPSLRQVVQRAGGNAQGLRLAPDGGRITYLSVAGYPPRSHDLAGFDAANFQAPPVVYQTSDGATPTLLAYHPTLDLVASPGGRGAVLLDRESGKPLKEHRLLLTSDGLGEVNVEDLWFSPDGRSLIFICSGTDGRYLRRVGLRLPEEEEQRLDRRGRAEAQPAAERPWQSTIPRDELQALGPAPDSTDNLAPEDITRRFTETVVQIQCADSTATGFVVGKDGYILTSAHAVPVEQDVTVAYQLPVRGELTTFTATAELAAVDDERDIALLKIRPVAPLVPVTIAPKAAPEAGQPVTVIGNPTLGERVLSHTVTTGVVSSPRREIDGQIYIQTSAPTNPGSSGGPIFDNYGRVVGLVAVKTHLEGTGFGIPAEHLRRFLSETTETRP